MTHVTRWTIDDVCDWLEQCLQVPADPFRTAVPSQQVLSPARSTAQEIHGQRLIELSDEDLRCLVEDAHLNRLRRHLAAFKSATCSIECDVFLRRSSMRGARRRPFPTCLEILLTVLVQVEQPRKRPTAGVKELREFLQAARQLQVGVTTYEKLFEDKPDPAPQKPDPAPQPVWSPDLM